MIRVAIVDDDEPSRNVLRSHLRRLHEQEGIESKVEEYDDGSTFVAKFTPRFDIVLFDIEMPHLDGLTAAQIMRETDQQVPIIFITAMSQYAIRGYEVNALSYLVKPITYFSFFQEINKALSVLESREKRSIVISSDGQLRKIPIHSIIYIESIKHHLHIHTTQGRVIIMGTLKGMAAQLENDGFYRSNSCYLVNLSHVQAIRGTDSVMSDGTCLAISRSRRKGAMEAVSHYYGRTT